jgi:hypothetical protein
MTHLESRSQVQCNFSVLRHLSHFNVCLSSTYIASGRFISSDQIAVLILDHSEMADTLRAQSSVPFEIDLGDGRLLAGMASAKLGTTHAGNSGRRFIDVIFSLEEASEEGIPVPVSQWLT